MRKAALMLVLCCLLWGYSFPVMQLASKLLEGHVVANGDVASTSLHVGLDAAFLGWRFGLAALITAACWRVARSGFTRLEVGGGAALGVLFAAGMVCQLGGLRYTLPSVSSFITSLTVVFTPLAQALIFRRRVLARTWLGVALALIGMTILAQPNPGACVACQVLPTPPLPYFGEALTVLGAVFFTALVLGLDRAGSRCNPVRMSLAMFCSSSILLMLVGAALCGSTLYRADVLSAIGQDQRFIVLLVTLTFFSSVLAINLMYRYQKFVSPAVASVIYSTESVFATLFSLAFVTEILTLKTVLGGSLILSAFFIVTLPSAEIIEAAPTP